MSDLPTKDELVKPMVTVRGITTELPDGRLISFGVDADGKEDGYFMKFVNKDTETRLRLSEEAMAALVALYRHVRTHEKKTTYTVMWSIATDEEGKVIVCEHKA